MGAWGSVEVKALRY